MQSIRYADAVLYFHFLYVLCVAVPIPIIILGGFKQWNFVRIFWARIIHFSLIGIVIVLSVMGEPCPLTVIEDKLRRMNGETGYYSGFINHWCSILLYYNLEQWMFTLIYLGVGILILSLFYFVPPNNPYPTSQKRTSTPKNRLFHSPP